MGQEPVGGENRYRQLFELLTGRAGEVINFLRCVQKVGL